MSKSNSKLTSIEVGQMWEENAETWTALTRKGYDLWRDQINTPGFFSILPSVSNCYGIDIGCGEGHNTRLLALRGAQMTAIDISPTLVKNAKQKNEEEQLNIKYLVANAVSLPFPDESFDFATAFVSLMDIPEYNLAIKEAYRVLKKGGFFQFSITHPCYWTHHLEWINDENGKIRALACKDYFESSEGLLNEWIFDGIPEGTKKFKNPIYRRTLSEWINMLVETGFILDEVHEPRPSEEAAKEHRILEGSRIVPFFLIIRCLKK